MIIETKVTAMGNSLGIVLPEEALAVLHVKEGATLHLTTAPGGALRITPDQPGFKSHLEIADRVMKRYPNALRQLAD